VKYLIAGVYQAVGMAVKKTYFILKIFDTHSHMYAEEFDEDIDVGANLRK